MMKLVVDLETDNLYQDVTKIHCLVIKSLDTGKTICYYEADKYPNDNHLALEHCFMYLQEADQIIGHNFIDFDMRVLEKLHGIKLDVNKIIDTYLLSIMLDPHRRKHPDCPPSRLVGEKRVPIGPHSLQNWGYVVERGKVEHEDWSKFTKEMLHRCVEDVNITELVAKKLGII